MKKTILPLLLILASFISYAQGPCVPGAVNLPQAGYIIPDSATNFVKGCEGQYYEQIIYIKAPKDTQMSGLPATIDSFVVDASIMGLPAYLSISTVPALTPASPTNPKTNFDRLIIKGDSMACIKISGNIPAGTSGNNPLVIGVRAYLKITGIIPIDTLANINYYNIDVMNPCWPVAVSNIDKYNFDIVNAIPNPTANNTQISFLSNNNASYTYKIVNATGQTILTKEVKANNGLNYINIDMHNYSNGIYMFSLSNGNNLLSKRIQVNK